MKKIIKYVLGTQYTPSEIINYLGLDCSESELEEMLLDCNIEICSECGTWVESYELVNEEDMICTCISCGQKVIEK